MGSMGSSRWQNATDYLQAAREAAGLPPTATISQVSESVAAANRGVHRQMASASDRMAALVARIRRAEREDEEGDGHYTAIVEEMGRGILSQANDIRDRRALDTLLSEIEATIACLRDM